MGWTMPLYAYLPYRAYRGAVCEAKQRNLGIIPFISKRGWNPQFCPPQSNYSTSVTTYKYT